MKNNDLKKNVEEKTIDDLRDDRVDYEIFRGYQDSSYILSFYETLSKVFTNEQVIELLKLKMNFDLSIEIKAFDLDIEKIKNNKCDSNISETDDEGL